MKYLRDSEDPVRSSVSALQYSVGHVGAAPTWNQGLHREEVSPSLEGDNEVSRGARPDSASRVSKQEGQALKMLIQTATYGTSRSRHASERLCCGGNRLRADEDTWIESRRTDFSKAGCG